MPALQFQIGLKILVRLERVETQAGEVPGCAEEHTAGLNDFLQEERVRPVEYRQIDLAPRELGLQCLLNLQDGVQRHVGTVELNRQVQIATGVDCSCDRRPELEDQANPETLGDLPQPRHCFCDTFLAHPLTL